MSPSGSDEAVRAALLALLLAGCGDGLVDGTYAGEPVFALDGVVRHEADGTLPEDALYVTIVWEPADDGGYEYVPALRVETTFPARYSLSVYAPPPASVLWERDGQAMGVGFPLLYLDEDGDGLLDPRADRPVGGADEVFLLYVPDGFDPPEGAPRLPDGGEPPTLAPGFHAVRADSGCPEGSALVPVDPQDVDLTVVDEGYDPMDGCPRE